MRTPGLTLAAMAALTACGGGAAPPDDVAAQLEQAYDREDGERVYALACPTLQEVSPKDKVLAEFEEILAEVDGVTVEVGEEINAMTYRGQIVFDPTDGESQTVPLLFVEEEGAWCYTYPAEPAAP